MRPVSRYACVVAVASLSVSWLGGCEDGTEAPDGDAFTNRAFETAGDGGVAESDGENASSDGGSGASSDATVAEQDAGPTYSDGELVGMVIAIHEAGSLLGRAAQPELTEPRLERLATDVADAHDEGNRRALGLGILPVPSEWSEAYVEGGEALRTSLSDKERGEPFDRAYLEHQIMLNAMILHQLETQWLAMADSSELHAELETTRETLQEHVDRGVALRDELFPEALDPAVDEGSEAPVDEGTDAPTDADGAPEATDADGGSAEPETDEGGSLFDWPFGRR